MAPRSDSKIWDTFGLAENLLGDFEHWTVLLRAKQVTPGSMVLIANRLVTSMADLAPDEGAELGHVCARLETCLRTQLGMEKINYLALMMVDPHLHFHVIPRYSTPVEADGREWSDSAWPGPPDLAAAAAVDDLSLLATLRRTLQL
jgi:diadenosine tetraphosphate (Ap4A) HIT family hydrolase